MTPDKGQSISRPIVLILGVTLAVLIYFSCQPEANGVKRLSIVGLTAYMAGASLYASRRYSSLRKALIFIFGVIMLVVLLPWRERTTSTELRGRYVLELNAFEGSPYFWGGESKDAVDCSGLIRRALIDACFHYAIFKADPGLLRRGISLWWNDTSAQALGSQHEGLTKLLFTSPNISSLDHSRLMPGDFAVTRGGIHAMAYIGEGMWIEADPGELRVIKVHAQSTKNDWFDQPVNILRWSCLDP